MRETNGGWYQWQEGLCEGGRRCRTQDADADAIAIARRSGALHTSSERGKAGRGKRGEEGVCMRDPRKKEKEVGRSGLVWWVALRCVGMAEGAGCGWGWPMGEAAAVG